MQPRDVGRTLSTTYPFELLAEIFKCLALEDVLGSKNLNVESDAPRWPAPPVAAPAQAQVCARWRVVALSSSSLWRTVQVNISNAISRRSAYYIDMLLERSRTVSLDVLLRSVSEFSTAENKEFADHLFSRIVPRARRLHLDLYRPGPVPDVHESNLDCLPLPTPQLVSFSLNMPNWGLYDI